MNIIYNRVSTKDQNPELQKKDCIKLAESLGLKEYEYLQEKESGWKDEFKREVFESIKSRIEKREVKNLIVWDLDRLFRNRKKSVEFIRNYGKIGLRVYSYRQNWLEKFKDMPEPFDEIMREFMIQIVSWMAEDESNKKSERVKNAVVKEKDKDTKSYKGNKWGRKELPKSAIEMVLELNKKGHTIRKIAKEVKYWDSSNHQRNISKSAVHKILTENQRLNTSQIISPLKEQIKDNKQA